MLMEALTGAGIGAAFAAAFWALVRLGLDRLNQGLLGSAGLVALVAVCLWLEGWVLTGVLGFVAGVVALTQLHSSLR